MVMHPYEKEHLERIREGIAGCTVLLKSNGDFPLSETGDIALYGSGVRRTVKGGTGVTSIASECSFTMDVRSADAEVMRNFRTRCLEIAHECAEEEYARWEEERNRLGTKNSARRFNYEAKIELDYEEIGGSIGGVQDENCEIVTILRNAFTAAGIEPEMRALSSTDANIPLSVGIPAATISCGGARGGTHDISEWYDPTDAYHGVQKNLLCVLALTGVEGLAGPLISKTQTA